MVMGDMVLTQSQVNPVMSVALDNGLEVTALHNHFLWESPRVMFMHVGGMGDEAKLSAALGKVFAAIKDTSGRVDEPTTAVDPAKSSLDPRTIESVLGRKGDLKDGEITLEHGAKAMGDAYQTRLKGGIDSVLKAQEARAKGNEKAAEKLDKAADNEAKIVAHIERTRSAFIELRLRRSTKWPTSCSKRFSPSRIGLMKSLRSKKSASMDSPTCKPRSISRSGSATCGFCAGRTRSGRLVSTGGR